MTAQASLISIGIAIGVLALSYAMAGMWRGVVLILAVGIPWLLGQRRDWGGVASVGLVSFVGAAAVGLWVDLGAGWMVLGAVAALSAWDLDHFARQLRAAGRVEGVRDLEASHLRRLALVDGVALLITVIALRIKVDLGFGPALCLGVLAILGLSRVIGFLRGENDK